MGHIIKHWAVAVVQSYNRGHGQPFFCRKEVRYLKFKESRESQWFPLIAYDASDHVKDIGLCFACDLLLFCLDGHCKNNNVVITHTIIDCPKIIHQGFKFN